MVSGYSHLTDDELLGELQRLAAEERERLVELLSCLSEIERRKLHIDRGHPNFFEYCVSVLRWSEGEAVRRIYSARAASRFPEVYVYLRNGELTLSGVSRLWPHLERDNASQVLKRAAGLRHRDIEKLIIELSAARSAIEPAAEPEMDPELDFRPADPSVSPEAGKAAAEAAASSATATSDTVGARPAEAGRSAPVEFAPAPSKPPFHPRPRDVIRLEAPGLVRISFTASEELRADLERAGALSGPRFQRLEDLLGRILADFLRRHDPARRRPARELPRRTRDLRAVPRWVKDRVWLRDGGRCSFAAPDGTRCAESRGLQYDHRTPWALGGRSDDPENIRLLCGAHNRRAAEKAFGPGR